MQVNKKIDSPKYKIAQRTGLVIHKRKNKYLIKKEHLTLLFLNVQQINIVPCETDRRKHKWVIEGILSQTESHMVRKWYENITFNNGIPF